MRDSPDPLATFGVLALMIAAFLTLAAVQHQAYSSATKEGELSVLLASLEEVPKETYFLAMSAQEATDVEARLRLGDPEHKRPWFVVDLSTTEGSRLSEVLVDSVTWGHDAVRLVDLRTNNCCFRGGDQ